MKKRIFLLIVCLLTITVSLCLFTACGDDGKNNGDGGTTEGGTTENGGSSNEGGSTPCTHSYTSAVTKEAGC